ncbi:hypothetical protein D3C72_2501560 [compost metagenome]
MLGNAHPAVPDFDRQALTMTSATQHHTAAVGVANCVAEQVAKNPRQQLDVAAHQCRTGNEMQFKALTARHLGVFGG